MFWRVVLVMIGSIFAQNDESKQLMGNLSTAKLDDTTFNTFIEKTVTSDVIVVVLFV